MKPIILLFLGGLFVINIFFRIRLMKLLNEIKKHQIRIEVKDMISNNQFMNLIENTYPEHADLLIQYRKAMTTGLLLIV